MKTIKNSTNSTFRAICLLAKIDLKEKLEYKPIKTHKIVCSTLHFHKLVSNSSLIKVKQVIERHA